jgi:CheY-like chemotaxis protein
MGARPKILLVDDDPLMHQLYRPHIERAGYEVVGLMDGSEVGQIARRELPQVVIMDMVLPGADGVAAILEIKKQETTRSIPVIAISANQEYHQFRQQLLGLGAESFLSKPFSPIQLLSEIRRLDPGAPSPELL